MSKSKFIDDTPELRKVMDKFKDELDDLFMQYLEDNSLEEEDEYYLTQHLSMGAVEKFTQLYMIIMLRFSGQSDIEIVRGVDLHVRNVIMKLAEEGNQSSIIMPTDTGGIKFN